MASPSDSKHDATEATMAVTTVALLATMMTTKATMRMSRRSGADDGRNVLLADPGAAAQAGFPENREAAEKLLRRAF